MEKQERSKGGGGVIYSFLTKTTALSFPNQPFSPGRDRDKGSCNGGKGFSGPIISIVPKEARRKTRNGSFDAQEPTSPKVSCIGQIKHKKKACEATCAKLEKDSKNWKQKPSSSSFSPSSVMGKIFWAGKPARKQEADKAEAAIQVPVEVRAPSLGQMKKFSSGRESLINFDWKGGGGAIAGPGRLRGYYSDEEADYGDGDDDNGKYSTPYLAGPIRVAGQGAEDFKSKEEVNLWKRRTMAPPKPLELNETMAPPKPLELNEMAKKNN